MSTRPRPALILLVPILASCMPARLVSPVALPSISPNTVTALPVSTPTPSIAPETPTLPWESLLELVAGTIVASEKPRLHDADVSPDGKWLAEVFAYDCMLVTVAEESLNAYEVLRLTDTQSGESRDVESQVQSCGGIGAAGLAGISWSRNSRFFYFTNASSGMPEGCGWWEPPSKRLDVITWLVVALGSGPTSPDQSMRATWQGDELLVSSIEQGEIARFAPLVTSALLGQIAWSPGSSAVVYLQTEFDCYPWGTTYVVLVDPSRSTTRLLIQSEAPIFAWVEWRDPGKLLLRDQDDTEWTYDFATGRLGKPE